MTAAFFTKWLQEMRGSYMRKKRLGRYMREVRSGGSPALTERGEHIDTISSSLRTGRSAVPGFVSVAETLRQGTRNRLAQGKSGSGGKGRSSSLHFGTDLRRSFAKL
jgi:hypothetical protein